MNQHQIEAIEHMRSVNETAIQFLDQVRERAWANRLRDLQNQIALDPLQAASSLQGAFAGEHGFESLYLSGPRNGHALSERQEIEANGKLHVIRAELLRAAKSVAGSHAASDA
jgi:hypothetical protein